MQTHPRQIILQSNRINRSLNWHASTQKRRNLDPRLHKHKISSRQPQRRRLLPLRSRQSRYRGLGKSSRRPRRYPHCTYVPDRIEIVEFVIRLTNSLFVSRENYLGKTRKSLSTSLPFPHGFLVPTRLRAYAVRRCSEIGIADSLDEDENPTVQGGFTDSWLTRRRTWDEKARNLRVFHALTMLT
jgi:hypothetical protein